MRRGAEGPDVDRLWDEGGHVIRIKMTALGLLRLALAAAFIAYIIGNTMPKIGMYGIFAVLAVAFYIFASPALKEQSDKMTKTFKENLNERENHQE